MTIANRPSGSNIQPVTLQLQVNASKGDSLHTILMDTVYKYSHLCNLASKLVFDHYCTDRSKIPRKVHLAEIHTLPVYYQGSTLSLYHYLREYGRQHWKEGIKVDGFSSALVQQVVSQVTGSYNSMFARYYNIKSPKRRDELLTKPAVFNKHTPVQYNYNSIRFDEFNPSIASNYGYGTLSASTTRTPFDFVYGEHVRHHLMQRDASTGEVILPWQLKDYVNSYLIEHGHRPELLGNKIAGAKLIYRKVTTRKKSRKFVLCKSVAEGRFFLHVTLEKRTPGVTYNTTEQPLVASDYLGVDLGITNLATTSNGTNYSGKQLDQTRVKRARHRQGLQRRAKQLKSKRRNRIYRKIKKLGTKEYRFHKDVNHCLSKRIVAEAKRTCSRVIVLEDLSGIREQLKARRKQRSRMHSWSYAQLQECITYKAKLTGVRVITIDPRHTSQRCSRCGHTERSNRGSGTRREQFVCKQCAYEIHSDINAAINIRDVGHMLDQLVAA